MKYTILSTTLTDDDKICVEYEITTQELSVLHRSMCVPYDISIDDLLEKINDAAYNDIETVTANKAAHKERKDTRDALKKEIDKNIGKSTVIKKPKDKK